MSGFPLKLGALYVSVRIFTIMHVDFLCIIA